MHRLILQASKEYRDKKEAILSEAKAPRKIIWLVISLQIVELGLLTYLIMQ